jgi:hypothetical protein
VSGQTDSIRRSLINSFRRYDNCFLKWYSESTFVRHEAHVLHSHDAEFLRGTATTDECKPIFEQYEKCLSVSLLAPCSSIALM